MYTVASNKNAETYKQFRTREPLFLTTTLILRGSCARYLTLFSGAYLRSLARELDILYAFYSA